ncbi:MAG: UDP-glucose 4-epimerase GalE [Chloroflexota bacterium]|nr:UDP-glucose 4-epimerase GalE [Chloroflexota bacterium]
MHPRVDAKARRGQHVSETSDSRLLVTGGAGYIGSHVVLAFCEAGYPVIVLDDLSTGSRWAVPIGVEFIQGDVADPSVVSEAIAHYQIDSVVHLAAQTSVSNSVRDPLLFYFKNSIASANLLRACIEGGVRRFIFSSTAAVYGIPPLIPVNESAPKNPINPYGRSKLATEWMLRDASNVHDMDYIVLRYFNVAGADPDGRIGSSNRSSKHLIKVASEAAVGARNHITVFGTDYDTEDGTCVRDYIHVSDLADAHVMALHALRNDTVDKGNAVFNCGYGHGYSVREVLNSARLLGRVSFEIRDGSRRVGDPPILVADSTRIRAELQWSPRYDDLNLIIHSALMWEERLLRGDKVRVCCCLTK